jgi:hypothetical protein
MLVLLLTLGWNACFCRVVVVCVWTNLLSFLSRFLYLNWVLLFVVYFQSRVRYMARCSSMSWTRINVGGKFAGSVAFWCVCI